MEREGLDLTSSDRAPGLAHARVPYIVHSDWFKHHLVGRVSFLKAYASRGIILQALFGAALSAVRRGPEAFWGAWLQAAVPS